MRQITRQLVYSISLFIIGNASAVDSDNSDLSAVPYQLTLKKINPKVMNSNVIINKSIGLGTLLPNDVHQNTIIGQDSKIVGSFNVGVGADLTVNNDSIAIGNYSHALNNSESLGSSASSINNGIAIGTQAYADDGFAIGSHSYATKGSIAIGDDSIATEKNTVSFGSKSMVPKDINGKISWLTKDITRRLMYVSNGKDATDAVNVSQLTKVKNTLSGEIETNSKNIAGNTSHIATNTSGVANNSKNIAGNTSHIISNNDSIKTNRNNINTNTYGISQLHKQAINYTNVKTKQTLKDADNYTDEKIKQISNEFNSKIHQLRKEENAGIASAMAMSVITVKQDHKYNIGMGLGYYGNQEAVAIGSKINISNNSLLSVNTSYDSNHSFGVAAGITFGFD